MSCQGELADLLASVLPASVELIVRHVSSTPAPSQDLFAAAPGHDPEPTFCENHFLSVSIESRQHEGAEIIIFGMEVLVFNTAHLTTIFVSKADSTGLLHLLDVKEKVSVLRLITSTFLSFLVKSHIRPGVRLVVSLFARAQDQYLFPGSIDNAEKHVLDDRGLIKWWCRALDPIIREHGAESVSEGSQVKVSAEAAKASATAYLIVPGCDRFETRSFFPVSARSDPTSRPRWLASYPLQQLCRDPAAPPRCLVPRFPDDPKTRFLIDLDDELPESEDGETPSSGSGHWKSVKSIDQFWELMAFRQECSAGRLVGFLWLVVNPPGLLNTTTMASRAGQGPSVSQGAKSKHVDDNGVSAKNASLQSERGTHVAHSTKPPTNEAEGSAENNLDREVPLATTAVLPEKATLSSSTGKVPFYWPESGRGEVVLQEADYKKMMDGVLDQFYDSGEIAASTQFYIDQVASLADQLTWGKRITGTCSPQDASKKSEVANNLLSGDLVRKRKKPSQTKDEKDIDQAAVTEKQESKVASSTAEQPAAVNVLGAGLIRKKKKT